MNYSLRFQESWVHAVGGCLCKNSKGETICSRPGEEMAVIFCCFMHAVREVDIDD